MSIGPIGGLLAVGPADPPKPTDRPGEPFTPATGAAPAQSPKTGEQADKPGPVHVLAQETAGIDNLRLRIERDPASGQFVYYGVDPSTGEVMQQYPPREILARIAFYRKAAGLVGSRNS